MRKFRLPYIIGLISLASIVLVALQLYQANELYERTLEELDAHIENTISKVALKHEKAADFKIYDQLLRRDFRGQYRSALKEEFQYLMPVQETVSIRDTFIIKDGEQQKYLYISGSSFDSITQMTTKHSVLARDISEMGDVLQTLSDVKGESDASNLGEGFDKRVISKLFKKSKFINQLMTSAFKDLEYRSPNERIDVFLLDSIIQETFRGEAIGVNFDYMLVDESNEIVRFPNEPNRYNIELDTTNTDDVRLFPGNIFDEEITLHFSFYHKASVLLSEMWSPLLVSLFLILLIIIAFSVMFRTILGQKRLAVAKNDFISNMTHEFKTPISTIALACEALGDNDMIQESQRETIAPFVKMIGQENNRLESLVERILQSASLEKGKLKIRYEELELNEIVSLIAQKSKMRIQSSNGKIQLQLAPGFLYFKGDPVHTMNLVSNLVDNAIKYSKEAVDITLTTFKKNNHIYLVVSDKGIGIKKEYLDKIFDKLYRVPTGNVHDVKGFGLGLSYVKTIAETCGWEIQVQSKWNVGSDFTLIIKNKQDKK